MSSGPVVAAVLKKEDAVEDFRELIGSTDPAEAKEGTIRKLFAESKSSGEIYHGFGEVRRGFAIPGRSAPTLQCACARAASAPRRRLVCWFSRQVWSVYDQPCYRTDVHTKP